MLHNPFFLSFHYLTTWFILFLDFQCDVSEQKIIHLETGNCTYMYHWNTWKQYVNPVLIGTTAS